MYKEAFQAVDIESISKPLTQWSVTVRESARVRQALMGGFASSKTLEVQGERMVKRTFDPGFRIERHQKDLNLALGSALGKMANFAIGQQAN